MPLAIVPVFAVIFLPPRQFLLPDLPPECCSKNSIVNLFYLLLNPFHHIPPVSLLCYSVILLHLNVIDYSLGIKRCL